MSQGTCKVGIWAASDECVIGGEEEEEYGVALENPASKQRWIETNPILSLPYI